MTDEIGYNIPSVDYVANHYRYKPYVAHRQALIIGFSLNDHF